MWATESLEHPERYPKTDVKTNGRTDQDGEKGEEEEDGDDDDHPLCHNKHSHALGADMCA